MFLLIPEAAVLPILVFIGIEITAQSFHVTPNRHYAAIAIACIPALAKLVALQLAEFGMALNFEQLDAGDTERLQRGLLLINVLAGGFIFTSLIWASATARMIDRHFKSGAIYLAVAGVMVLFGVMHSPLPGDRMFWPSAILSMEEPTRNLIIQISVAYFVMAGILFGMDLFTDQEPVEDVQH